MLLNTINQVQSHPCWFTSFLQSLTPSDIIQIWGIITSLVVSIVAIVISIKTLRQNSEMIEESTRPNIQIYSIYINSIAYIIIKNFGQSSCVIDTLSCDHEFSSDETFGKLEKNIFDKVSGALMTPGYAIKCPLIGYKATKSDLNFDISYHSSCKKYSDHFCFNIYSNSPFADTHPSTSNDTESLKNISNDLHDLVKMKL